MSKKVAVIGGGPGGYVAAIRLAQLGADVHLYEKDRVGGTCLNRGCIPTKTYFKTAEVMHEMKYKEELAIIGEFSPEVDGLKLYDRKQDVVNKLVSGIEQLLGAYPNITVHNGMATLENSSAVNCAGEKTEGFDAVILANGSKPQMPKLQGIELEGVINSDHLLELKEIPESMVVVGGGVIGLEFASIYCEMGTEITVLSSRILKNADAEISKRLPAMLKKQGMTLYNDIRAQKIESSDGKLKVTAAYKSKDKTEEVFGQYVLIAGGRGPVFDGLDCDALGIEADEKGVSVDKNFETSLKNVYAIGDVVRNNPQLAHVASAQGEYVAELIMGHKPEKNLSVYPNCVFTLNEVAHVGATEEELKEKGIEYKTSKFNFVANGKALCLNDTNGFVKVIADNDNKVLGVHIIGPHANDLIAECALAVSNNMKIEDINRCIHAHPTLAEAVAEASAGITESAIHQAPVRRKK